MDTRLRMAIEYVIRRCEDRGQDCRYSGISKTEEIEDTASAGLFIEEVCKAINELERLHSV